MRAKSPVRVLAEETKTKHFGSLGARRISQSACLSLPRLASASSPSALLVHLANRAAPGVTLKRVVTSTPFALTTVGQPVV